MSGLFMIINRRALIFLFYTLNVPFSIQPLKEDNLNYRQTSQKKESIIYSSQQIDNGKARQIDLPILVYMRVMTIIRDQIITGQYFIMASHLPESIKSLLQAYTQVEESQLLHLLTDLSLPDSEVVAFNEQLEMEIMHTFRVLISGQKIDDLCSLLNLVWKSLKNKTIKKSVLITVLDSVLECVGISELKDVLNIIRERVGQMREILADVQYQILRIINTLLKRISKTTDFQVRGELHLTITRIINFCHESGFEYRANASLPNDKIDIQEDLFDSFKGSSIGLEFYEEFWELQKYFMDLHLLNKHEGRDTATPGKEDPKLTTLRLKRIEITLQNILNYFRLNPPIEHKDFANFPIKFLKLPNLLVLQLQDSYFRMTFLVQVIIFCSSLKMFPAKYSLVVNEEGKDTVERMEKKVQNYLQNLLTFRKDGHNLIKMMSCFLKNDQLWIQLKDNWRERKKTFFKNSTESNQIKKATSVTENTPQNNNQSAAKAQSQSNSAAAISIQNQRQASSSKKTLSLLQLSARCQKQIQNKLEIRSEFIQKFLQHKQAPVLKKQPISPSFSYYYSQARQCLDTFDDVEGQTEFESRSQYNMFEWKAFRSLERERIITGVGESANDKEKASKFADFRLLEFVKRKEEIFEGEIPRKRVKLEGQAQDRKEQ